MAPRVRFFFKRRSEDVLPGDSDGDCHQYSLTPSAICREPGGLTGFDNPRFKDQKRPRLNGGEQPGPCPCQLGSRRLLHGL